MGKRTFQVLSKRALFQKSLRFSSLMNRGRKTIGDLFHLDAKWNYQLIKMYPFNFPIIVHRDVLVTTVNPYVSPFLTAVINDLQQIRIEACDESGTRFRLAGIEIDSRAMNNIKMTPRWIECSSFADILYAHLMRDPLFNEEMTYKLIRATAYRVQTRLEYEHQSLIKGNPASWDGTEKVTKTKSPSSSGLMKEVLSA